MPALSVLFLGGTGIISSSRTQRLPRPAVGVGNGGSARGAFPPDQVTCRFELLRGRMGQYVVVSLLGHPAAIGDSLHITSDDRGSLVAELTRC